MSAARLDMVDRDVLREASQGSSDKPQRQSWVTYTGVQSSTVTASPSVWLILFDLASLLRSAADAGVTLADVFDLARLQTCGDVGVRHAMVSIPACRSRSRDFSPRVFPRAHAYL